MKPMYANLRLEVIISSPLVRLVRHKVVTVRLWLVGSSDLYCQTSVCSSKRRREGQITLTRIQPCQSKKKKCNTGVERWAKREQFITGGTDKNMWWEWVEETTMQRQSFRDHLRGRNVWFFCMESVQWWVSLPLGRLIACWFNVLSPPVPEN